MIQSMTGFGKASLPLPTKKITVEIKSLNSKGLDVNTRMPSMYREMELGVRNLLSQRLERGKIDFSLFIEITGEETASKINAPIVKGYIAQMREILPEADATELMKMAVRMPDALKTERDDIDASEWTQIQTVIDEALSAMIHFRCDE
ncbi:MAG: YicC/YloC family endoribonuclease, partial [Flavobacterium sp.]